MVRGREQFAKYKKIINMLVHFYKLFPQKIRKKMLVKQRNCRGVLGIVKRYAILKTLARSIGDNVCIGEGVFILSPENLSMGNNVSIHPMCYIDATGSIDIGNDVSIAHGVTIMSSTHNYADSNIPIKDQEVDKKRTLICDNVWIGAKAVVLYGNTINSGSVVAAGAIVTKDVQKNSIVAGVPAKEMKRR